MAAGGGVLFLPPSPFPLPQLHHPTYKWGAAAALLRKPLPFISEGGGAYRRPLAAFGGEGTIHTHPQSLPSPHLPHPTYKLRGCSNFPQRAPPPYLSGGSLQETPGCHGGGSLPSKETPPLNR